MATYEGAASKCADAPELIGSIWADKRFTPWQIDPSLHHVVRGTDPTSRPCRLTLSRDALSKARQRHPNDAGCHSWADLPGAGLQPGSHSKQFPSSTSLALRGAKGCLTFHIGFTPPSLTSRSSFAVFFCSSHSQDSPHCPPAPAPRRSPHTRPLPARSVAATTSTSSGAATSRATPTGAERTPIALQWSVGGLQPWLKLLFLAEHSTSSSTHGVASSAPSEPSSPTSAPSSPTSTANSDFVQQNGTTLSLNGQPYRFTGINIYMAASGGTPAAAVSFTPMLGSRCQICQTASSFASGRFRTSSYPMDPSTGQTSTRFLRSQPLTVTRSSRCWPIKTAIATAQRISPGTRADTQTRSNPVISSPIDNTWRPWSAATQTIPPSPCGSW